MRSAILIGLVAVLLPQAAACGPVADATEARMVELEKTVQARVKARAWDDAADEA